ncbi:MAG: DUF4347 domain-containing protein, partial [Pirellulaceae bacterium]
MNSNTFDLVCRTLRKLSRLVNSCPVEERTRRTAAHSLQAGPPATSQVNLVALEDRVLYDAAPLDINFQDVAVQDADPFQMPLEVSEAVDWAEVTAATSDSGPGTAESVLERSLQTIDYAEQLLNDELQNDSSTGTQLVVIDMSVDDVEALLEDIASNQAGTVEYLYVDAGQNGFQLVADKLDELGQVSAIHILSHGDEGLLHLGEAALSVETASEFADEFAAWQDNLSADGDVLIYGCELAASDDGQQLLQMIAAWTGADVAASTDVTGHASQGGDWV